MHEPPPDDTTWTTCATRITCTTCYHLTRTAVSEGAGG
ncbi:hypothetical protein QF032_006666 [Streptomyces achromogenes]|nr:hypothetical protein [Streptomyces achromogenes]